VNEADEPSDSFMKGICRDVRLLRSDILSRDSMRHYNVTSCIFRNFLEHNIAVVKCENEDWH